MYLEKGDYNNTSLQYAITFLIKAKLIMAEWLHKIGDEEATVWDSSHDVHDSEGSLISSIVTFG